MWDVGSSCRADIGRFLDELGLKPASWWDQIPNVFEPELASPTQVQVRLDAGFVALGLRSHYGSLRLRCYRLLGDDSLDFSVASGCERLSKRFPEDAWGLKLAISGIGARAKFYLDRRLTLDEMEGVAEDLGLPPRTLIRATRDLLEAAQTDRLRWLSVASGDPMRVELYTSCPERPGGATDILEAVGDRTRMLDDPSLEALMEAHRRLASAGRQRYCIGVDGRGIRDGLKTGYEDVRAEDLKHLLDAVAPAPAIAQRRMRITNGSLGSDLMDHVSVRLRPGMPAHITAYYNRTWASVA